MCWLVYFCWLTWSYEMIFSERAMMSFSNSWATSAHLVFYTSSTTTPDLSNWSIFCCLDSRVVWRARFSFSISSTLDSNCLNLSRTWASMLSLFTWSSSSSRCYRIDYSSSTFSSAVRKSNRMSSSVEQKRSSGITPCWYGRYLHPLSSPFTRQIPISELSSGTLIWFSERDFSS